MTTDSNAAPLGLQPGMLANVSAPQPVTGEPPASAAQPFVLSLGTLETIASNAGLEWVNSDAEKIRAAQEAMAREPAPVHVPRERKPLPAVDEGPLVLVETRKDLSQIKLPFEASSTGIQGTA